MKISIIITNYNYANYLPAAINSALAQTYSDQEIIIVDDGSKDDSRNVITQFQQKYPDKIKAIFQENQGQAAAFNTGFEAAKGEIIAFLDADDVWKPNKLQRVVEVLNQPDVVGTMHLLEMIDREGNVTSTPDSNERIPSGDLARVVLNTGNAWWFPPTSGLAYRRSILTKVFPMDTGKWRLCADGCLVYCTAFLGKIKTLNEVLGSYRLHGANNFSFSEHITNEQIAETQAGIEMTNQYLNEFLRRINYSEKVDLARNLQYRRTQYYLREKWDIDEMRAISGLILGWPFYSWQERAYYLARFWIKSVGFLIHPTSHLERRTI